MVEQNIFTRHTNNLKNIKMAFKMKGSYHYGKNPLKHRETVNGKLTKHKHEDGSVHSYDKPKKDKMGNIVKGGTDELGTITRSPAKQKNQVKIVGEDTGEIKKDKNNQTYVIQEYDTQSGLMRGDTIQLVGDSPRVGDYLMGGDYYGKETEE